jgi:hypothetical protein
MLDEEELECVTAPRRDDGIDPDARDVGSSDARERNPCVRV